MTGPRDPDRTIQRLAASQDGVVSRNQMLRAGLTPATLDYRVGAGRLEPLYRGVYRVGPVVGPRVREFGALLACGEGAVLSHRTAAALWELLPPSPPGAPIHVTAPRNRRGPGRDVRVHRTIRLDPEERARRDGLVVTSPTRTLLDLALCAGTRELRRAVDRVRSRGLVGVDELDEALARHSRRNGTGVLRRVIQSLEDPRTTRSEAEERFLELVRRGGLPRPLSNVTVEGLEVDFLWRRARLVVEIDGYAHHGGRAAFERDRRRDQVLAAAGYRVVRISWRQLTAASAPVLVRVAQALVIGVR